MSDPRSTPVSPRRLPQQPNLEQLKKQAKELLEGFRSNDSTAVAEVRQFERNPDPCHFALNDAQRVLARAYGLRRIRRDRGQPTTKIVAADKASPDVASRDVTSQDKPSQIDS